MAIPDEDLQQIAQKSYEGSEHPMGWIKTFSQGYRQAEADIEARILQIIKDELNGLSDIEKVSYFKYLQKEKEAQPSFSEKVMNIGRKKVIPISLIKGEA